MSPPVLYVLLSLADRPRHGYDIMRHVETRTKGRGRLLPGSLYNTLKRMVDARLIEESPGWNGGRQEPRRRYYRITSRGKGAAKLEIDRLANLVDFAAEVFQLP